MRDYVFADAVNFAHRADVREIYCGKDGFVLFGEKDKIACAAVFGESPQKIAAKIPAESKLLYSHGRLTESYGRAYIGFEYHGGLLPVNEQSDFVFRTLNVSDLDYVLKNYNDDEEYLRRLLNSGVMLGAFYIKTVNDDITPEAGVIEKSFVPVHAGFIGEHESGTIGLLFVDPVYRRRGLGFELETRKINELLLRGIIPAAHVAPENIASLALQRRIGMSELKEKVFWYVRQ